jgi:hypothetical protein
MPGLFDNFGSSFDMGEDEDEVSTSDNAAQSVVDSLDDDEIDEELSEAEKRLAKAAYYKAIVRNGVIEDDGTSQATEVNAEARVWARQMMGKLLGLASAQPAAPVKMELPFTPNEVGALKKLAGIALAKMGETASEPVVKKVEAPATPQVRKVQAQQQAKSAQRTEAVGKSAPKAKAKPQPAPSQTVAANGKKKPGKVRPSADGTFDYDRIPSKTPFTDVDGQVYKFVDNPNYDPDRKGSKPRTKLKVTNQVRGTGAIPTPNKMQMEAITASQSMETVNNGSSASASSPFGAAKDEDKTQNLFVAAAASALRND